MASEGNLRQAAAVWLSTLVEGRRRLQDLVHLLSSPSLLPPEVVGGPVSAARWVATVMQQMLETIWVMEVGPAPELDEFVDWCQTDALLSECYTLLDERAKQGADMARRSGGKLPISMLAEVVTSINSNNSIIYHTITNYIEFNTFVNDSCPIACYSAFTRFGASFINYFEINTFVNDSCPIAHHSAFT
ncbi:hypothetical protein CBR_g31879 [Chara braunii]|uniref:Uncharacterized protein n=1 Tax=Chara braunii TaxID=69332 RepID=A0A388LG15_CHABU|nr:hypothetical protein CBR_g31879 [Chara braunii]|eukprot:GBG81207.1 hypothetical protein CBR_g31879 [Chara braunii]